MIETLSPAQLATYFARIGYTDAPRADLATLTALHRTHVQAIPFENLDVQLGTPPGLDPQAAFAKLVERRRGGWCYEQNGLFAAVLHSLGFPVTRMAGGVLRQLRGDFSMGSHLFLKVSLEQDWLVDVGFGSSQLEPLPLAEGEWDHVPIPVRLARTDDHFWRFAIQLGPGEMSYDFRDEPADEALLQRLCDWQGSDPHSVFVQNLVAQRRVPGEHRVLRGRVFTRVTVAGTAQQTIADADELLEVLASEFGIEEPAIAVTWPDICARHTALFG